MRATNDATAREIPDMSFVTACRLLRVFFRHDRRLYGEISRLIYRLVCEFTANAAGRKLRIGAVIAFQSSGEFARWNPH
jgi:hypothetical protein